jgi:hypothetical protein
MQPARKLTQDVTQAAENQAAAAGIGDLRLAGLVSASVATRGQEVVIRPVAGHEDMMRLGALDAQSTRLAAFMRSVEPEPNANVLIVSGLGEKTLIAMLACLKAGLTPCLVPVDHSATALTACLERLEAPIAIGVGGFGELRPLINLREAAMRSFHLRLAAGFGPHVPDGIADLDVVLAEETDMPALEALDLPGQLRLFAAHDSDDAGIVLPEAALMAASLDMARELRATPGSRIITTMVGTDLASLATSFGAGLLAGLEITPLGLFSLARLWACLSNSITTHLVVPASLEEALIQTGATNHKALTSLVFVHEIGASPADLPSGIEGCTVLDVWRAAPDQMSITRR